MPNTLAHFALQGPFTRLLVQNADLKWIALGIVIPDFPWIIQRIVGAMMPGVDPLQLRLYSMVQASLMGCLIFSTAIAVLSRKPAVVFVILALNSLLHLLLDAAQTKWGNGVHLLAPFSWQTWNFGLFWPESAPNFLLTLCGFGYLAGVGWRRKWGDSIELIRPTYRAVILSAALLCLYITLPIVFTEKVALSNTDFLSVIKNPCSGCPVSFDRVVYEIGTDQDFLKSWSHTRYKIEGKWLDHSAMVSLKGVFVDPKTIKILKIHEHSGFNRDIPTYIGLSVCFLLWARSAFLLSRRRAHEAN